MITLENNAVMRSCNTKYSNVFSESNLPNRFYWIDWTKTIGMFLIVMGHFFSFGHKYLYVFSVPLFFVLSGFLFKVESNNKLFWRKLLYNLMIPMVLIVLLCSVYHYIISPQPDLFCYLRYTICNFIIGNNCVLGRCWFIYTLIILKVIFQYANGNKYILGLLFILFSVVAILLENCIINQPISVKSNNGANSIANVLVSYPFFLIGYLSSNYKKIINSFKPTKNFVIIVILSVIIIFLLGRYNGYVWMYRCGYGNNYMLFLLGGIIGTIFIIFIAKYLNRFQFRWVTDISMGSILILGFHYQLIDLFTYLLKRVELSRNLLIDIVLSILIMALFIPVIRLTSKYFPLLLGKYRK